MYKVLFMSLFCKQLLYATCTHLDLFAHSVALTQDNITVHNSTWKLWSDAWMTRSDGLLV